MAKRFNINQLPKEVREKVHDIVWNEGDFGEDILGQANLNDEWVLSDNYSHIFTFTSKKDLINIIKYEVTKR